MKWSRQSAAERGSIRVWLFRPIYRLAQAIAEDRGAESAQNLASIVELMPIALAAMGVCAAILGLALWPTLGGPALAWWLVGEAVLLGIFGLRWRRAARRADAGAEGIAPPAYRNVLFFAAVLAAPWAVLAVRFVPAAVGAELAVLMTVAIGVATGGAVFLGRMTLAGISFAGVILTGVGVACLRSGDPALLVFATIMPLFGAALIAMVVAAAGAARARDRTIALLTRRNVELRRSQLQIERMALQDPETGLPNRKALLAELDHRLRAHRRGAKGAGVALAIVDIVGVKAFGALYGHGARDDLMALQARRLAAALEDTEMLARLEDDRFAVILDARDGAAAAMRRVRAILATAAAPATVQGRTIHPRACGGVALADGDDLGALELAARAAEAARIADCGEPNAAALYSPNLMRSASEKNAVEADLRRAIADDALTLMYQPKVCLKDLRVIGAEALLRWRHPEKGMQPPDVVFPLAAERGFLPLLSRFVFDRVTTDLGAWKAAGLAPGRIAVNVHPLDFGTPDLLLGAFERLRAAGFGAEDVVLEITEDCVFGSQGEPAAALLEAIRDLGFELSLDDFGTGRASLSHLRRLPVSEIKIDREFISGLGVEAGDEAIVCAALEVARRLKIRSIAEGVETAEQERILRDLGCRGAQGYLYSRPLSAEDYAALLRSRRTLAPSAVCATLSLK